ncbi:DUF6789 family protein [Aquipuribacter hungaricus]|uniref:DUF6789 family protein n=1 Tax=Aquipuribacter hungaricus TaxID=545624 RepID=A0ABV7WFT4_9MICO
MPSPPPRTPRTVTDLVTDAAAGAAAGALATVPMSGLMLLAQRLGLMGVQPPRRITDAALGTVGARPSERARRALTALDHLAFGAGAGAVFAVLQRAVPRAVPRPLLGAAHGLLVWAVSYAGWVAAAGIMPPAHRDRTDRQTAMVAAHLVYGSVLGAATARLLRPHAPTPHAPTTGPRPVP